MPANAPKSRRPRRFGTAGSKLWAGVLDKYELEPAELILLEQAALTADHLDELAGIVAREGLIVSSPSGERAHPALVESRQQQVIFAKLLGALRLPDEHDPALGRRPQQRFGVRPMTQIGGA
jgi:hypothetical protein